jgi:hypothetical protein
MSDTVSLEVAIEVVLRNGPNFELIAGLCKMAAEAEREACAKLCDEMESRAEGTECCKWPTPADCAYAIRARGEKK